MKLTVLFNIIIIAIIAIYDTWTLAFRGYDTTISWTLYTYSLSQPIIPFAIGIICGHLFWPNRASKPVEVKK